MQEGSLARPSVFADEGNVSPIMESMNSRVQTLSLSKTSEVWAVLATHLPKKSFSGSDGLKRCACFVCTLCHALFVFCFFFRVAFKNTGVTVVRRPGRPALGLLLRHLISESCSFELYHSSAHGRRAWRAILVLLSSLSTASASPSLHLTNK